MLTTDSLNMLIINSLHYYIDFPGLIQLTNVTFENINTIVSIENVSSFTKPVLPGIIRAEYFGTVELRNV